MRGVAFARLHQQAGRQPQALRDHLRQQRHLLPGRVLRPDLDNAQDGIRHSLRQDQR